MTFDKATTCCGKSAECVCGTFPPTFPFPTPWSPPHMPTPAARTNKADLDSTFQPSKPSAHAERSPPSTAPAARPLLRTPSPDPAARAALAPPASAPATAPAPRTSSLPARLAPAVSDLPVCSSPPPHHFWIMFADDVADACTCDKASDGSFNPSEHEIDFTTRR